VRIDDTAHSMAHGQPWVCVSLKTIGSLSSGIAVGILSILSYRCSGTIDDFAPTVRQVQPTPVAHGHEDVKMRKCSGISLPVLLSVLSAPVSALFASSVSASTNQFRGVNWADSRDNFQSGVL
jgi:hypothetical protein